MQSSGSFRLVVRRGPQPNQVYELRQDIITLGREASNDISINDPEVSRHHCRFTRAGGGYTLEDLGSTNGTFINGQRLTGARPLTSGDHIGLGETVVLVYEAAALSSGGPYPQAEGQPTVAGPAGPGGPPPGGYYQQQPQQQPGGYGQQQQPGGYGQQQPGGYGQQQPGGYEQDDYGAPPAPPPPDYIYDDEPYVEGGMGRWIFLACGVFMVLCIVSSVIAIILIDQSCAWDNIPLVSDLVDALGYTVDESACN